MRPQEIFDTVTRHLAQQGKQSLMDDGYRCAYRGADGAKCAAGVLIPDDQYLPHMEGFSASALIDKFVMPAWFVDNIDLIADLQRSHDWHWRSHNVPDNELLVNRLRFVATEFGLDSAVVDTAFA